MVQTLIENKENGPTIWKKPNLIIRILANEKHNMELNHFYENETRIFRNGKSNISRVHVNQLE